MEFIFKYGEAFFDTILMGNEWNCFGCNCNDLGM